MVWSMYSRKYYRRYGDQRTSKRNSTGEFAVYADFVRRTLVVMYIYSCTVRKMTSI